MKKILPAILIILTLLAVPFKAVRADYTGGVSPRQVDFGDFAGDSDYGGGGDWGGGWDSDDDYSYSGGSYSGSGSSDGDIVLALIVIAIIVISSLISGAKDKKKRKNRGTYNPGAQGVNRSALRNVQSYMQVDPNFSASQFTEKLANLYVRFQNSWTAKNMNDLRPYLTDAIFAQMDRQLNVYRQNQQTNRIDRIAVLGVELLGWTQENGVDKMYAQLRTRIVDYVVDDRTGKVIRGSNTAEKFMTYEWELVRTTGVVTGAIAGTNGTTCPYCGARVDINHSAVCEYCDSVLTTDTFDWAVNNIKGISQQTR